MLKNFSQEVLLICYTFDKNKNFDSSLGSLAIEIGFQGGSTDIPCEVWPTEESVSSEVVVDMLHRTAARARANLIKNGVPGIRPISI